MRAFWFFVLIVSILRNPCLNAQANNPAIKNNNDSGDPITDNQRMYNGKIWKNQYYLVKEDQFLYSKEFLMGSISIRGRSYTGVPLKYDIYKDEILTPTDDGVLQINKEMIDSFSLSFNDRKFHFIKLQEDTVKKSITFFNIAYKGNTSLLIRYYKKIDKLVVEGKYDQFYQVSKVFLFKENKLFPVTGKNDMLNFMADYKAEMKEYIKKNKMKVSDKDPESFIPVVRYYDSLNH